MLQSYVREELLKQIDREDLFTPTGATCMMIHASRCQQAVARDHLRLRCCRKTDPGQEKPSCWTLQAKDG